MSSMCGEDVENIWTELMESSRTDYRTATYLLLLDRKQRGLPLRLPTASRNYFRNKLVIYRQSQINLLRHQRADYIIPMLLFQTVEGTPKAERGLANFITKLDQSPGNRLLRKSPIADNTMSERMSDEGTLSYQCRYIQLFNEISTITMKISVFLTDKNDANDFTEPHIPPRKRLRSKDTDDALSPGEFGTNPNKYKWKMNAKQ